MVKFTRDVEGVWGSSSLSDIHSSQQIPSSMISEINKSVSSQFRIDERREKGP